MTKGERIRIAREAAGLTQEDLGRICNTTKQTIYKYENGIITNIPLEKIELISKAVNVPANELVGWDGYPWIHTKNIDNICKSWVNRANSVGMGAIEYSIEQNLPVSLIREEYLKKYPADSGENPRPSLLGDSALLRILLACELELSEIEPFFTRYGVNPNVDKTTLLLVEQVFLLSHDERISLLADIKHRRLEASKIVPSADTKG